MIKTIRHIIIYMLVAIFSAVTAQAASLAQQADSAYNKKDFNQAVRLYHQSINTDGSSAVVLYNMGNAYYRIGNLGRAIICYERALKLDPSMKDAKANLNFVKTKILDKPEDDSTFFDNIHASVVSMFTPNTWAVVSLVMFTLLLGCVALYIFSGNITLRKIGFFGGFIILVIFIYTLVITISTVADSKSHDTAIVVVPTTNLTSAPGATQQGDKVVPIHEGTKVEILDSLSTPDDHVSPLWYDVKINNSTRAWLRASDVEKI